MLVGEKLACHYLVEPLPCGTRERFRGKPVLPYALRPLGALKYCPLYFRIRFLE